MQTQVDKSQPLLMWIADITMILFCGAQSGDCTSTVNGASFEIPDRADA